MGWSSWLLVSQSRTLLCVYMKLPCCYVLANKTTDYNSTGRHLQLVGCVAQWLNVGLRLANFPLDLQLMGDHLCG